MTSPLLTSGLSQTPAPYFRRDLVSLFMLALAVNTLAARFISHPGYMDAYYYFGGARQLAHGQGFTEPYLWNYLDQPSHRPSSIGEGRSGGLPHPSHLYWMPLPTLAAAPLLALAVRCSGTPKFGLTNQTLFRFAQVPFILLASALPLLSYLIATLTSGLRRHAWAAGLLTLFSGFYFIFWTNTDAFALYGLTAGGALLAYGIGSRVDFSTRPHAHLLTRPHTFLFLSGLCAGLAHLTRADGVFVIATLLLLVWLKPEATLKPIAPRPIANRVRVASPRGTPSEVRTSRFTLHASLILIVGYLVIALPWLIRNFLITGSPLQPGGTRALWLTEYNDLFSYPASVLTPARYFATGWGSILAGKGWAFQLNLGALIGAQGLVVAFPFIVIGLWKLRRNPLYRPALLYAAVLFALMTFVFTFPGARGGFFHSGAALLPFFFSAAPVGLDTAVEAAARRRPHWKPEQSKPGFTALLVACAIALTGLIFYQRVISAGWARPDEIYAEIGAWLAERGDAQSAQSVVAVVNPPGFYYFTGHPSIVIPNGSPETLLKAMTDLDARWAVLDFNHPDGLKDLYDAPQSEPQLRLRATFTDANNQPVYLFERMPAP
jgi:hypothetical protein